MVGIVVVSHSHRLAEAAVELALQMAQATPPPIEIAAGLDDGAVGTDAVRVKQAIDNVASGDGVLVVMDLGSAVMSAEMALELRDSGRGGPGDGPVVLSAAPLVEGLVAAVALAANGAPLSEVAEEAGRAGLAKTTVLGRSTAPPSGATGSVGAARTGGAPIVRAEFVISNEHGLHARPAARFVATSRRFDAEVSVRNLSGPDPSGPRAVADGRSLGALSTLGVLPGHRVEVTAKGRQAQELLAAIATLVSHHFDEPVAAAPITPLHPTVGPTGASPGIGIGPKTSIVAATYAVGSSTPGDLPTKVSEADRLSAAIEATRAELSDVRGRVAEVAGEDEAAIFDAHFLLLDDEELTGRARRLVEEDEMPAASAWGAAVSELAARFSALPDPYMRARAQDVKAVGDQVLAHLAGSPASGPVRAAGVVVAGELTPAQIAGLDPAQVVAIVTSSGSAASHASILARSMGIPKVVGAGIDILNVAEGTTILVDGSAGRVVVDPPSSLVERYGREAAAHRGRAAELIERARRPAVTTDGVRVEVGANIGRVEDALEAVRYGADAVGLLRTEILFLDRAAPPDETEQTAAYLSIAQALDGRRLTVRTLDVGGDKPVPYLPQPPEANPFLGRRGLRLSLGYPEVFKQQLRAIVRTGQEHPVTVLFPMVTTVGELRSARALLSQAAGEVGCEGGRLPWRMEVGAMAEVPAFVLRARAMVPMLDVVSIGSNDLAQYTTAADRGNADVAALADALDPAVLRLIAEVTRAAGQKARVTVCGEMANEPGTAVLLLGLGVRQLSMTARAVPEVKEALRTVSVARARQLAKCALRCHSADGVRDLLAGLP